MDVLPELGDGAGEVGGVLQGVVGEAAVGVPSVPAALPRQVLGSMHTVSTTSAFFQTANPLFIYLFISKRMGGSSGWAGALQPKALNGFPE